MESIRRKFEMKSRDFSFHIQKHIVSCDLNLLGLAFVLICIGILLPLFFTERSMRIYDFLTKALVTHDAFALLSASFRLIALNMIRSTPCYIGVFLFTQTVHVAPRNLWLSGIKYTFCFLVLAATYRLIGLIYNIHYVVKWPAIVILIIVARIRLLPVKSISKIIVIFLLLLSVQGMDVVTGMEFIGFGHGEIAMDIKAAAAVLSYEKLLLLFSSMIFIGFLISALLVWRLAYEKRQLNDALIERNRMEVQLNEARIQAVEMRCDREMQNLVHDLKSPLTTIQGLASLTCEVSGEPMVREFQTKISSATDRMSRMISEILYADKYEMICAEDFVKQVMAHFSTHPGAGKIRVEVDCPQCIIHVNVIRMIRALVNVLDNACKAVEGKNGMIVLRVEKAGDRAVFYVRDNGCGIPQKNLDKIWLTGYSGTISTGLGLAFVKQVVEGHGGEIRIESEVNHGTLVTISIPQNRRVQDAE